MALGEHPVANVAGADHRLGVAVSGALRSSLHDDGLQRPPAAHHLQSGRSLLWTADRNPADQVSVLVFLLCMCGMCTFRH